jgi:hypothetical protein
MGYQEPANRPAFGRQTSQNQPKVKVFRAETGRTRAG